MARVHPTLIERTAVALAFVEAVRAWREGHHRIAIAAALTGTVLSRPQRRQTAVDELDFPRLRSQLQSGVAPKLDELYGDAYSSALDDAGRIRNQPMSVGDPGTFVPGRLDDLVASTRDASDAVARAVEDMDPWTAAGLLVDTAGLNAPQVASIVAYRNGLVAVPPAAEGTVAVKPLADDLVTRRVDRFVQLKLRKRGNLVGAAEPTYAVQTARLDAWRYYGDHSGFTAMWIEGMTPMQEWVAREGACDECAGMDGKRVGIYEEFPIPLPPHPSCRCIRSLIEVPAGEPTVR